MADDPDTVQREMAAQHAAASRFAEQLVGLAQADAAELAGTNERFDVHFLAEGTAVTLDFRPSRIRATVVDDRVVSATAG